MLTGLTLQTFRHFCFVPGHETGEGQKLHTPITSDPLCAAAQPGDGQMAGRSRQDRVAGTLFYPTTLSAILGTYECLCIYSKIFGSVKDRFASEVMVLHRA